jgi:MinD-like ATPase involved in chromosome partitioning or flagellar assembly
VGGAVVHRLPSDYRTVIDALNSGEPYVIEAQGRLTIAQRSLAADLAGEPKERPERPSGGLTRLMLRRT